MTVAVVTDSAAALPDELARELRVSIVPMYLTRGSDAWQEGTQPFDVLEVADSLRTSGPTPDDFSQAIERARAGADAVVVLTIAATMSSTHEAAVLGAGSAGPAVRVIDTRTAAGAEALVVIAAARAAAAGGSIDEVVQAAQDAIDSVHLVATVPSLDHLVRSGRVPNIAGLAGRWLGISPLFEFVGGGARPLRPALSDEAARARMVAAVGKGRVRGARLEVAALHTRAEETAQALLAEVTETIAVPDLGFVASFGAVMQVHIGPGLVGLAWRWAAPAP